MEVKGSGGVDMISRLQQQRQERMNARESKDEQNAAAQKSAQPQSSAYQVQLGGQTTNININVYNSSGAPTKPETKGTEADQTASAKTSQTEEPSYIKNSPNGDRLAELRERSNKIMKTDEPEEKATTTADDKAAEEAVKEIEVTKQEEMNSQAQGNSGETPVG